MQYYSYKSKSSPSEESFFMHIYFTLDKNSNKTGDMSAWSPTVKYLPVSFQPNPYELKDTVSIAPNLSTTSTNTSNATPNTTMAVDTFFIY